MMNIRARATETLYNNITEATYYKYKEWFEKHPEYDFCYWAREDKDPIKPEDIQKPEIRELYPAIKDYNDHAKVRLKNSNVEVFHFCIKYRDTMQVMFDNNMIAGEDGSVKWSIVQDPDIKNNFILVIKKA